MNEDTKFQADTWTHMTWTRVDIDVPMTVFINRLWGKKRRQRFTDEVNAYRGRVLERDRQRIAKIIAHKFKQSEKSALKLVTYYELPGSPKRKVKAEDKKAA